jgi:hypothetical protein
MRTFPIVAGLVMAMCVGTIANFASSLPASLPLIVDVASLEGQPLQTAVSVTYVRAPEWCLSINLREAFRKVAAKRRTEDLVRRAPLPAEFRNKVEGELALYLQTAPQCRQAETTVDYSRVRFMPYLDRYRYSLSKGPP